MNTTDNRIKVLESYYAEIDSAIALQERILDTYNGMLAFCDDGEGSDAPLAGCDRAEAEIAALRADRAEIDRMWNESVEGVPCD